MPAQELAYATVLYKTDIPKAFDHVSWDFIHSGGPSSVRILSKGSRFDFAMFTRKVKWKECQIT
jgi:hypothetical protein